MIIGLPEWAQVSRRRIQHIERVAELLEQWAEAMGTAASEYERWGRAALLHDALKDAPVALLRELAPDAWDVDALRHGPAAAAMAAQHGETDSGVLNAIRYHSVGFAGWDAVGRMLYLADFLEPGRQRGSDRAALVQRVYEDPSGTLRIVAQLRLGFVIAHRQSLLPETVDFWNQLACVG